MTQRSNERKRTNHIALRGKETEVNGFKKQVDQRRTNSGRGWSGHKRIRMEAKCTRTNGRKDRKDLEISRTARPMQSIQWDDATRLSTSKRRKHERSDLVKAIEEKCQTARTQQMADGKEVKKPEVMEWKEQVVRVGTGYRVRIDEKDARKRRFDVGYSDLKEYKRKEGRQVTIESSNMGRTVTGKGKGCRVKVMNAVCDMEKRRPASEYTGSGILRKNRVGTRKLKSTKGSGKE